VLQQMGVCCSSTSAAAAAGKRGSGKVIMVQESKRSLDGASSFDSTPAAAGPQDSSGATLISPAPDLDLPAASPPVAAAPPTAAERRAMMAAAAERRAVSDAKASGASGGSSAHVSPRWTSAVTASCALRVQGCQRSRLPR
jgi:hypothetical protein